MHHFPPSHWAFFSEEYAKAYIHFYQFVLHTKSRGSENAER